MTIRSPIATGVSLIALGIFLLITSHARGQTTEGLTAAQKAQVADPANPQFAPPWNLSREVVDDQTAYVFPATPGDEVKAWALKRAFQLNGNSMVGNNRMIDLSKETPFSIVVPTEKITVTMPTPAPRPEAQLEQMKPVSDTCTRHGLHRVTHGKSWSCR